MFGGLTPAHGNSGDQLPSNHVKVLKEKQPAVLASR